MDRELTDDELTYPYWPTNHEETACREQGAFEADSGDEIEGGWYNDCLHLCDYEENTEEIYDPEGIYDTTNGYCAEGYTYSEKFAYLSNAHDMDICQTICVPEGEELQYIIQPAH